MQNRRMHYLVGDLQGCDAPLQLLLDEIGFSASRDRIVLLGDLVNRGPESLTVLRRLVALGDAAGCLLGNHDLHLLAVAGGVRRVHSADTMTQVLNAPPAERDALLDWVRQQPLARMEAGWLCVHAGVVPQWTVAQTLQLASEVSGVLRGPGLAGFLQVMYGNQPDRWHDGLQGDERLRLVVNVLTRIRFCSSTGQLDFDTKEGAGGGPPGFMPWFAVPGRQTRGQPIAFGHWSTLGLINQPDLLALDTGCVWGGALTAVRVDGGRREVHQVACQQAQRPAPKSAAPAAAP